MEASLSKEHNLIERIQNRAKKLISNLMGYINEGRLNIFEIY